jgi:hypothetical protein
MGRKLVKIPHYSLFGTWDASLLNIESSEQSILASGSQGLFFTVIYIACDAYSELWLLELIQARRLIKATWLHPT